MNRRGLRQIGPSWAGGAPAAALAPAALAVALAAALAPAAQPAPDGPWALAQAGAPAMELLHAGAVAGPPLVALHASPEPAELEIVARGVGDGASVSVRVLRTAHWGGAPPGAPPSLDDHGGGEATMTLGRASPGETVLEVTASGAAGEARGLYVVRVLNALPPEGSQDRAPPSYIVGNVGAGDPARPRILAQASLPLCAEADPSAVSGPHRHFHCNGGDGHCVYDTPAVSGVPPIEGAGPNRALKAEFGRQAYQWVYLDRYMGSDREHYYMQYPEAMVGDELGHSRSPYTNMTEVFASSMALPRAAAPGPYWDGRQGPFGGSSATLYFAVNGTTHAIVAATNATKSLVPEILPLDGKVEIMATAFHGDMAWIGIDRSREIYDATPLTLEPPPGVTHALVNGTELPLRPGPTVAVRVSEIARQNGILIEGITDGGDTGGMELRKLHEVTLVAELPVDVGDAGLYGRVDPARAVAPWECWPRLGGGALVP